MRFSDAEAQLVALYTLSVWERERETTKSVLAALPDGRPEYAPDPKSMPALKLAFHVVSSEKWFLDAIAAGAFSGPGAAMPEEVKTGADVAAWYEANVPASIAAVKALPAEAFNRQMDLFGKMQAPAYAFLSLMQNHAIHHRGQLSAYLRPMGGKVPAMYGPSADSE